MGQIINLYGGPSTGKSTVAAGVFSLLKLHGVDAELVTEFAKGLTWEGRDVALSNQYYIWGKQLHKLFRVIDQVDIAIVDSPLLLSLIYGGHCCDSFHKTVLDTFNEFDNINIFLKRVKPFSPSGRKQNEEEARELDTIILQKLNDLNIKFDTVMADFTGINDIVERILPQFNKVWKYRLFEMTIRRCSVLRPGD